MASNMFRRIHDGKGPEPVAAARQRTECVPSHAMPVPTPTTYRAPPCRQRPHDPHHHPRAPRRALHVKAKPYVCRTEQHAIQCTAPGCQGHAHLLGRKGPHHRPGCIPRLSWCVDLHRTRDTHQVDIIFERGQVLHVVLRAGMTLWGVRQCRHATGQGRGSAYMHAKKTPPPTPVVPSSSAAAARRWVVVGPVVSSTVAVVAPAVIDTCSHVRGARQGVSPTTHQQYDFSSSCPHQHLILELGPPARPWRPS